jgi:hypothetical protein
MFFFFWLRFCIIFSGLPLAAAICGLHAVDLIFLPARRFLCLFAYDSAFRCSDFFGLSLISLWSISFPPVRGSTYFSLPAAKKSRQKKAGFTPQVLSGHLCNQRGVEAT